MPWDWKANDVCLVPKEFGYVAVSPARTRYPDGDDVVAWFNLSAHQRVARIGSVVADRPEEFVAYTDQGLRLSFRRLTVADWNRIHLLLSSTNETFATEALLHDAARRAAAGLR